jgi:hypothetical protein
MDCHAVVEWVACTTEAGTRMHEERETSGRRAPTETAVGRPETRAIE